MSISLTYSNYSALHSCGRKFKLQCIDLIPQPRAVALEFGSAMHAGLHDVLVNKDVENAQDVFIAYWDSVHSKLDFSGERHKSLELRVMGNKFIANFHKKYGKDMELILGEERLYAQYEWQAPGDEGTDLTTLDGEEIAGTPDALVKWNGKRVLLDFKTAAYNYLEEKTDSSLQLNLYAWLLMSYGLVVDELAYVVFCKGTGSIQTVCTIPYDAKKALALIDDMVTYWNRNVGHYEKNPNACIMGKFVCPYFNKCWKENK